MSGTEELIEQVEAAVAEWKLNKVLLSAKENRIDSLLGFLADEVAPALGVSVGDDWVTMIRDIREALSKLEVHNG